MERNHPEKCNAAGKNCQKVVGEQAYRNVEKTEFVATHNLFAGTDNLPCGIIREIQHNIINLRKMQFDYNGSDATQGTKDAKTQKHSRHLRPIIEKSGDEKGDESNQFHRYHEKPDGDGFVCMKPEAMKNIGNGIGSVAYQI